MSAKTTLNSLIERSNGTFVTVTFTKKDGTTRVLNGRMGVTAGVKGVGNGLDPKKFITIFDVKNNGFRAINRDTITEVKVGGIVARAA
jgi:hypothetical protein